jgi:hypothetical protein
MRFAPASLAYLSRGLSSVMCDRRGRGPTILRIKLLGIGESNTIHLGRHCPGRPALPNLRVPLRAVQMYGRALISLPLSEIDGL